MTTIKFISRRRTKLLALVFIAAFFMQAVVVDRIVAVVGDEVITERELDAAYNSDELRLMRPDPLSGAAAVSLTREEYLDKLINQKVIALEVYRQGVRVDVLEIEKTIDGKREELGVTEEEFERALAAQGMTMDQYREQVKEQMTTMRLVSQEVRGEVEVTDAEAKAYYIQHPEQFMEKDQYRISHIYAPFGLDGLTAQAETVSMLEGVRSDIVAGADFDEMAKLHSMSPTAPFGGDLGWFGITELLPEFRENVKKLSPGQVSPVFVQGQGAHLIKLQEIKKGELMPFDEVKNKIRNVLYQGEAMERYDLWLERLKARTHIENRLKKDQ